MKLQKEVDFSVVQKPLYFEDDKGEFEETPLLMNYREDTGSILGYVSQGYSLIDHKKTISSVWDCLEKMNLIKSSGSKSSHHITKGGSRVLSEFILRDSIRPVKKDEILLTLWLNQSYDGSLAQSFNFGLRRVICSNGATTGLETYAKLVWRHTLSFMMERFMNELEVAVENYKQKSMESITNLIEMKVEKKKGIGIIASMCKDKETKPKGAFLPARMKDPITEYYTHPKYDLDKAKNGWSLYNAFTYIIERDEKVTQINKNDLTNRIFNHIRENG